MKLVESIFLDCIYVLFPLFIYIFVNTYYKTRDKRINNFLFKTALFSSIYLLYKYGKDFTLIYPMIFLNIPLLVAYLKDKNKTAILASIILMYCFHEKTDANYILLLCEYLMLFISYRFIIREKTPVNIITNFIVIESFILSIKTFINFNDISLLTRIVELVFTMSIFILISYICLFLLTKAEEVLDLNKVLSELEKEKALKNSIFKVTHEIKNPIAVCKGYLDMIDYDDKIKTEKYIDIVKDQIKRTLILMDDFLSCTKVKVNKEVVDLYMLIEDSCDVCVPLLKKDHIKLDYDYPDKELYMDIDYNRFKQVIVNIFKNSIEAIDKNKKDKYIKVDVFERKDEVEIKIKDNGIGMDNKTLKRVYEMFYTTKDKGTGLGVALSKEIIELHDGSINYSSIKDKYTIVSIILPRNNQIY